MEYSEWPNPKKVASKFIPPKPENESHSNSASNQIRTPAASNFIGSEQKIQLDPNAKVEITNIAKKIDNNRMTITAATIGACFFLLISSTYPSEYSCIETPPQTFLNTNIEQFVTSRTLFQ